MRSASILLLVCFAALAAVCSAQSDIITNLPGAPAGLNYKQYAGYITVNDTNARKLFYWFVESQRSPSTDPVVLWLNGGPGCSSLLGAFGENGPLWINKDGATLRKNANAWNTVANVIYLESPAGVGFSTSNVTSDYTVGDERTAYDAYVFLVRFFAKYPQFSKLPFWVSGESYGGHYVPNLAKTIIQQNALGVNPKVNLVGFQVGNAWTDAPVDNAAAVQYWWTHALISDETYTGAMANCDFTNIGPLRSNLDPVACDKFLNQASDAMAGLNIYEIYSDICLEAEVPVGQTEQLLRALASSGARTPYSSAMLDQHRNASLAARQVAAAAAALVRPAVQVQVQVQVGDEHPDEDPCLDAHLQAYMNRKDVQTAIHAAITYPWTGCSSIVQYSRADLLASVVPVYRYLLTTGIQMLVYSGDVDAIVSITGTRDWLGRMALPVVEPWRPYLVNKQVGGFTVKYKGLTFASVRDAGHMVPWVQPERSLYLFSRFLNGQPL